MPDPVSPLPPRRTSIETTLGRIFAATAAVAPAGRCCVLAGTVAAPMRTDVGAESDDDEVACAMTPPIVPPRTAVTALTRTSIGQLGELVRHDRREPSERSEPDAGGG